MVFGPATLDGTGEFHDHAEDADLLWKFFYNDGDAAEDAILFEEDLKPDHAKQRFKEVSNAITKLEKGGPVMGRFLLDLDPDEDVVLGDLAPIALRVRMSLDRDTKERGDPDGDDEWESEPDDGEDEGEKSDENDDVGRIRREVMGGGISDESELTRQIAQVLEQWEGPQWDTGINELMEEAEGPAVHTGGEETECRALIKSWLPEIEKMVSHGKGTTLEFSRHMERERAVGMWMI